MRPLILIFLLLLASSLAWAQPEPSPSPLETPVITEVEESSSKGFRLPFDAPRDETQAQVVGPYSGRHLFTIFGAEGFTAAARVERIINRIERVAQVQGENASLVSTTRYGTNVLTLVANDQVLVTVTSEDLDLIDTYGLPVEQLRQMEMEVAEEWRVALQKELTFAAYIQRSEYLWVALPLAALTIIVALLIHNYMRKLKLRRMGTPVWGVEVLLWGCVLVFNLWLFPATKGLAKGIHSVAVVPFFRLWFVIFVASIASNLIEGLIHRYFALLRADPDIRPRRSQRLETFASVACKTVRALMMLLVFLFALAMLPIDFTPFLTGAGVLGIAIGLAAQDLLKDLLAGVSILIEDRFGVGDWIEWDKYSGLVESINLQYCQIRTIQGGLVTVPNADLRVVNNLSNEWSQVDFLVRITHGTDIEKAIRILTEEANQLAEDLSDEVLSKPDIKGVQELDTQGITLRLFIKTKPLRQWDVERELKKRVKLRFDAEGIEIPIPQSAIWLRERAEPED